MADSDKVILLKIEVAQAQANANVKKLEASLNNLDGRTKEYTLTLKKLQLERAKLADLRKTDSKSISNYANELGNANKQTGAATSATLEFGRVLSDAPYGIRGVANNLQQLASNLFFMSKGVDNVTGKTLGFGGAIKSLGRSLLGPAGVLVLFQGFIALIDYMSNRTGKAEKQINLFNEALVENSLKVEKMKVLAAIVNDNTASIETQKDAMIDLKKLGFDPAKKSLDEFIKSQEKLAVVNASIKAVEELLTDVLKRRLDLNIKAKKEFSEYFKMLNEGAVGIDIQKAVLDQLKLDKSELDKEEGEIKKQYQDLITRAFDLTDVKTKSSIKKLSPFKNLKDFDEDAEDYLEQIRSLAKKTELLNAKTQVEKIEIERKHHIQNLKIKHEEDKEEFTQESEAYKAKLKLFLDYQVKTGKMSQGQANQELSDFNINISKQLDTMDENFPTLLIRWQNYYTKKAEAAKISEIGTMKPLKKEIEAEFTLEDGLRKYMELQSSMTSFLNGEYDRQLTIEQNKTNALNNELNQRLLNENLSKDERERIQLQIGRNDEKLRKTQEAIEKKRFKLNKAANMAGALINTYLSATKAYASQLIVGDPSSIIRAKIAAGVSIASGLLSVAAIARTKFQSSAGSGGTIGAGAGGAGSGGEGREFNFNLAGSTQSNQLTQSIASQLNQPIQAYVVSSDITSQQQLDLNISNTATIG